MLCTPATATFPNGKTLEAQVEIILITLAAVYSTLAVCTRTKQKSVPTKEPSCELASTEAADKVSPGVCPASALGMAIRQQRKMPFSLPFAPLNTSFGKLEASCISTQFDPLSFIPLQNYHESTRDTSESTNNGHSRFHCEP